MTPHSDWHEGFEAGLIEGRKWTVAELAEKQGCINAALNIGHNDDCLFCGFKDKFLLYAARAEEGGDS